MKKVSEQQLYLTVLSVVALLVSNIIAAKQFKLPFEISMTSSVVIFPITYILSDVFSEVYGYRWSRITCYLGFAMNLFMVIVFMITIALPASSYYENQEAYATILGSTPRILFASLSAFVLGDWMNDKVFESMRKKQGKDGFGVRAIVSSIFGEIIDSAVFFPLAFWGVMPGQSLFIMGVTQVFLKVAYEIVILPITTLVVHKVGAKEE